MGTSNIFNGRNDRNPLLPEDYVSDQEEMQSKSEQVKWQTVKSDMSKYINSGGTYSSPRHIARQYVRAAGGSRQMTSQAHSGMKVGGNIGGFFNSIVKNGLEAALKNLGIEYLGKPASEIFSRLVTIVAPDSNTKEDIAAKEAAQIALSKIYDYVEENDMNINSIDNMPPELMNEAMKEYIGSYIWITMMKDLGSRLEMYIANSKDAYNVEYEFKDMIMGIVDVEFKNRGDMINKDASVAVKELYGRCLDVLEGIV